MTQDELNAAIELHLRWLNSEPDGVQCRLLGLDLTGLDFSDKDLMQIDLRRSNLTNCNFANSRCRGGVFCATINAGTNYSGTVLTDTDFELSDISSAQMVGAIINGDTLTATPFQFTDDYWCMLTDKYIQIGCQKLTVAQVYSFTDDDRLSFDKTQPRRPVDWWIRNEAKVRQLVLDYAAL